MTAMVIPAKSLRIRQDLKAATKKQVILALVLLVVIVFLGMPLWQNYKRERALKTELDEAQKQIDYFKSRNQELSQLIDYLKSEQAVEDKARLDLGLKKDGEQVMIIGDDNNQALATTSDEISNPRKWLNFFFKG